MSKASPRAQPISVSPLPLNLPLVLGSDPTPLLAQEVLSPQPRLPVNYEISGVDPTSAPVGKYMISESFDPPVLDCQGTTPSLALGLEAKGPVFHWSKPPSEAPDSFGPRRWPGFSAAFDFCNKAVEKFPPMSSTWSKYLFLRDLDDYLTRGQLPMKCLGAFHRAKQAEMKLKKFGFWQLAGAPHCSNDEKQIMIDGTVEFNEELPIEETIVNKLYYASDAYKKELTGLSLDHIAHNTQKIEKALKNMISKNILKRIEIIETVKIHHIAIRSLIRLLNLTQESLNPTMPGRTWLCLWPCIDGIKIDGMTFDNDVALIVANIDDILHRDMSLLLCRSQDIDKVDRDLFATKLQSDAILLNEEQRLSWGCSLNSIGRVYWAVPPGSKSPNRQKQFKKNPGRTKKQKTPDSVPLVEPLPEGAPRLDP